MKSGKNKTFIILIIAMIIFGMTASVLRSFMPEGGTQPSAQPDTTPQPEETQEPVSLEAGISDISKYGNITLTVSPESMKQLGFETADIITVSAGDNSMDMPVGTAYSDVDSGNPVCVYAAKDGEEYTILAVNMGSLASALGIAEKKDIEEAPGYEWIYNPGFDENMSLRIEMKEKQGYAEQYAYHQILASGTASREDYPDLNDTEYANFREISGGEMGKGTLYRSSSPVDPSIGRNKEADEALSKAGIKTVMNMADYEDDMKLLEGWPGSYYSDCKIIALNMGMDIHDESFRAKLAEGFRFIASNKGPYLIHCKEGKDRTGFAAAVLECLMGFEPQAVKEDYMKTFCNYYHLDPSDEQYEKIAASNLQQSLQDVFGIEDFYDESNDLKALAEQYLTGIGMTQEEIDSLRKNLSADYGGIDTGE